MAAARRIHGWILLGLWPCGFLFTEIYYSINLSVNSRLHILRSCLLNVEWLAATRWAREMIDCTIIVLESFRGTKRTKELAVLMWLCFDD